MAEEFLYTVCKKFCNDLLRDTCSNVCEQKSPKLPTGTIQFPNKLNVIDLFNTICKHEKYDFLTNKYMGNNNSQRLSASSSKTTALSANNVSK